MLDQILTLLSTYGYLALVVIIFLSSLGLPLPATAVILVSGTLVATGNLNLFLTILLIFVAAVAGDSTLFYLGKNLNRFTWLSKFQNSRFNFFKSKTDDNYFQEYFKKYGLILVFFSRWLLTPLCPLSSLTSGIMNVDYYKYLRAVLLGEFLWVTIWVGIGYQVGANWQSVLEYFQNMPQVLVMILFGAIFLKIGLDKSDLINKLKKYFWEKI
jgi:membrane protein DedA with SNARE-associated domain